MKRFIVALAAFTVALAACGCGSEDTSSADNGNSTAASAAESVPADASSAEEQPEEDDGYTLKADFSKGASDKFMCSDGWSNGSPFDCTWKKNNVAFEDGVMKLTIDSLIPDEYNAAEYRTNDFYGYGLYEVSMKPIKNIGVVSSFFTYTGPTDSNPWDEIDIEFLGKDTTKVQFNYYTDGKGNHEYLYDLGFDASEEFHTYGFEWKEDSITWYVDGEAVYTATENLPSTPGKLMMNAWNGKGVDGWLGHYDGTTPLTAEYQWARFTAAE
ncbi:Beta-glucanase, GH16 family [Ruminococcus sp. YE71]|uniref:beta-glucanase n=1 Tax=unclassified Ruminococcus TaxID=2608920 RepID=UPI0008881616|nr:MULTISPECIES: glycoside hydrolase family 16 protein [unclassified Ruminococcus]SDA18448.1 Beta-glucanase, GH16 family [Ruminococcus sp. YE78]SFW29924.1 Beta-glucanase, GH16 family [Ruminococcus sp. YE71]